MPAQPSQKKTAESSTDEVTAPPADDAPSMRHLSLRSKLTAFAVVISVMPLLVIGWIQAEELYESITGQIRIDFAPVLDEVALEVERSVGDVQFNLNMVAALLAQDSVSIEERVASATRALEMARSLALVTIYDSDGRLVDTLRKVSDSDSDSEFASAVQMPERLSDKARTEARNQQLHLGPAEIKTDAGNIPQVLAAVPIVGRSATWYAATVISLAPVQSQIEHLVGVRLKHREQAELFLVDEHGKVLAHSNPEWAEAFLKAAPEGVLGPDPLKQQRTSFYIGTKAEEMGMVGGFRLLHSELPWMGAVQQPTEIAYKKYWDKYSDLWRLLGLVALVAMIGGVLLARQLTAPIQSLVDFANALAKRDFDHRVLVSTSDELRTLGNALNDAAIQLAESERRIAEETQIRTALGRYLPEQLVDRITTEGRNLELGGERRRITVLFADVAGFTPLVEKHPAEDMVTILNQLFTILTEIVFRHGGTVDKFIGDCVMAFWGAPDEQPDHAERALEAAEDMLSWIDAANANWEREFGVNIELAIGVHTGEAVIGNFGSETRMEYTVIGDTVNLAARLEAIARPQQILISEATRTEAGDLFDYVKLRAHRIAGRREVVQLYEVQV